MFSRIDGSRMAFVLESARGGCTYPYILVGDGVGMLGCHLDVAVTEETGCLCSPTKI